MREIKMKTNHARNLVIRLNGGATNSFQNREVPQALESGAAMVEMALMVCLIALVAMAGVSQLGANASNKLSEAACKMDGGSTTGGPTGGADPCSANPNQNLRN